MRIYERNKYAIGLGIYLTYLLILTLNPFEFSIGWFQKFTHWGAADAFWRTYQYKVFDIIANVLLFIPVGYLLVRINRWHGRKALLRGMAYAGILSFLIESLQLIMPRSTSIIDIMTNSLGAGVGALWAIRTEVRHKGLPAMYKKAAILWAFCVVLLGLAPMQMNHLNSWNDSFPLLIGDENTNDRPWCGNMGLLTLYGKALSADEVSKLYSTNVGNSGIREKIGAVLIHYPNVIDSLPDSEKNNTAMEEYSWHFKTGKVQRFNPPVSFYSAARRQRAFSVETWIRTDDIDQDGPARIISTSINPDERNFTLGQSGRELIFRVRTPLNGPNGSIIHLKTAPLLDTGNWQHVIAVFSSGTQRVYVDGKSAGGEIFMFRDYFSSRILNFGRSKFSQFAVTWMLFFPLVLAGVVLFKRTGFIIAVVPPILVELYAMTVLGQSFDIILAGYTCIILLMGSIAGWFLIQENS
ncbi:VanZ family protein [bacterium]|nr:VanZ family protein [bacterium]